MTRPIVRFAPSPTGALHIGGARTAVVNVMFSRRQGGICILRIDDTDKARSHEKYTRDILDSLSWLGLVFQETYKQSERIDIHKSMLGSLQQKGLIYAQKGVKGEALVFKAEKKSITFHDLIRGSITVQPSEVEDFVVQKSDGSPTYLFASVADDIDMGITHLIRGEDHITNTFKQILLFEALNPSFLPSFAHLPLIHSEDGTKLSKRHGATSVLEFKKMGYLPQALLNTLFLLGWSPGGDREIIDFYEACRLFSIEHVNKNAAQFSYEKTAWLNGQYIKKTPAKDLVAACLELDMEKIRDYRSKDSEKLMKAIEMTKSRPRLLPDLVKCISFFFEPHIDISHPLQEKYLSDKAAVMEKMAEVKDELRNISVFHAGPLEESLRKFCRDKGIQTKELLMPLRVILTGQDVTPGIFEVMELMGKELCLKRLIDFLNQNPE